MHGQVKIKCRAVKAKYPEYFYNSNVVDLGSLNVNGTNRYLFDNCKYLGVDVVNGDNDIIVCFVISY